MCTTFHSASSTSAGARFGEPGIVQTPFGVSGCVARREQRFIAQGQRRIQRLEPSHQQIPAGTGAAVLDEADMTLGHPQLQRQFQLADAPDLAGPLQRFHERRRAVHDAFKHSPAGRQ
jgi:hypothetical protein